MLKNNDSIPVYFFPADMCESCIREINDLITSGEYSAANELLDEVQIEGYSCPDCIALEIAGL